MKRSYVGIALAAMVTLGLFPGAPIAAESSADAGKADRLVVRYALLLGGRADTEAPTSAGVLSREELIDFLLDWEPGVDNDEVREVFALNDLGELARQAIQLPLDGGSVSGVFVHGDTSFEVVMNVRPGRALSEDENPVLVQAEIRRNGEVVAGPMIHGRLGERVITTSSENDGGEFLFLVVEVDRVSADELVRRGLKYSWRDDLKLVDGDEVTAPVAIEKIQPLYTEKAREQKQQGKVVLRMVINEKGDVEDVEVIEGQPYGLTETAVEAASKWRFEPALYRGEPVAVFFVVTINFRLE